MRVFLTLTGAIAGGVGVVTLATALPQTVLFLGACYGLGTAAGQLIAALLGLRWPRVKDGRISAFVGLIGLALGAAYLLFVA